MLPPLSAPETLSYQSVINPALDRDDGHASAFSLRFRTTFGLWEDGATGSNTLVVPVLEIPGADERTRTADLLGLRACARRRPGDYSGPYDGVDRSMGSSEH